MFLALRGRGKPPFMIVNFRRFPGRCPGKWLQFLITPGAFSLPSLPTCQGMWGLKIISCWEAVSLLSSGCFWNIDSKLKDTRKENNPRFWGPLPFSVWFFNIHMYIYIYIYLFFFNIYIYIYIYIYKIFEKNQPAAPACPARSGGVRLAGPGRAAGAPPDRAGPTG